MPTTLQAHWVSVDLLAAAIVANVLLLAMQYDGMEAEYAQSLEIGEASRRLLVCVRHLCSCVYGYASCLTWRTNASCLLTLFFEPRLYYVHVSSCSPSSMHSHHYVVSPAPHPPFDPLHAAVTYNPLAGNAVLSLVFMAESLLKLTALGPCAYVLDPLNLVDFTVSGLVCAAAVDWLAGSRTDGTTVLRWGAVRLLLLLLDMAVVATCRLS